MGPAGGKAHNKQMRVDREEENTQVVIQEIRSFLYDGGWRHGKSKDDPMPECPTNQAHENGATDSEMSHTTHPMAITGALTRKLTQYRTTKCRPINGDFGSRDPLA